MNTRLFASFTNIPIATTSGSYLPCRAYAAVTTPADSGTLHAPCRAYAAVDSVTNLLRDEQRIPDPDRVYAAVAPVEHLLRDEPRISRSGPCLRGRRDLTILRINGTLIVPGRAYAAVISSARSRYPVRRDFETPRALSYIRHRAHATIFSCTHVHDIRLTADPHAPVRSTTRSHVAPRDHCTRPPIHLRHAHTSPTYVTRRHRATILSTRQSSAARLIGRAPPAERPITTAHTHTSAYIRPAPRTRITNTQLHVLHCKYIYTLNI